MSDAHPMADSKPSLGPIDTAAVRARIETDGFAIVAGVVGLADIAALRDFWLGEFARPRPTTPIVWGPYLGEPNGMIFDRSPDLCLYRAFDYLWNPPYHALTRKIAMALNGARNALIGAEPHYGELITEDRYGVYVTTSYYPAGEGWMHAHADNPDEPTHWHYILPLTFRGADYTGGGLFVVNRKGESVDIDARTSPGCVVFFDGHQAHRVERIVSNRQPALGRLQIFAIPVRFESPETSPRLMQRIPIPAYARAKLSRIKRRLRQWVSA